MIYFVARRIWACGDSNLTSVTPVQRSITNWTSKPAGSWSCINLAPSLLASIGCAVKLRFKDTLLVRTSHYYRQFSLSLVKVSPHISFKFNPIKTDTPIIRTVSMAPSESVLAGLTAGKRCTAASQSAGVESPKALLFSGFLVAIEVASLTVMI